MGLIQFKCFSCGAGLEFVDRVGFREECGQCGEDAHCCRNCQFYDVNAYNECKEPSAEVVREKDRNNYCDYFQANPSSSGGAGQQREDLLSAAEALFKKK